MANPELKELLRDLKQGDRERIAKWCAAKLKPAPGSAALTYTTYRDGPPSLSSAEYARLMQEQQQYQSYYRDLYRTFIDPAS